MTTKNIYKWRKSAFALLIATAIVFSMLPISAFALDDVQDTVILDDSIIVSTPATTDGGSSILTDGGEDDPDALLECDCESRCTEEAINEDCPVCTEHPEWCVVGVESPEIAPMVITPRTKLMNLTSSEIKKQSDDSTWGNPQNDNIDALSAEGWAWYWSADGAYAAKTLVLDGLMLTYASGMENTITLPAGSTIVVNNMNIIANGANGFGITSNGKLTIEGTGMLNVSSTFQGINSSGLEMKGGIVSSSATSSAHGINCTGDFTMSGGTILATGTGAGNSAMSVTGTVPDNLVITQSDGTPHNPVAAFNTASPKVIQSGGVDVLTAKIVAESIDYTLFLDNSDGNLRKNDGIGENVTSTFAGKASTSGAMNSWTLELNDFDFTTSAATALIVPTGTTIHVKGDATIASTITSGNAIGISSTGAVTVNVDAGKTLTVNTGNGGTHRYGINVGTFTKQGGGTLAVTAGSCSANSYGITTGDFNMTDGVIIAITEGGGIGSSNAMRVTGNISIGSIPVKGINISGAYTVDASFQDVITRNTTKTIQDNAGLPVYNAKLGKDAPAPGGGGSSGGSSNTPAPSAPVITPMDNKSSGTLNNAIDAAANTASNSGQGLGVRLKNVSSFTKDNAAAIIKKAKALGKKATVSSDIMSEDGRSVEVRVTVDPELITNTVRLDGYTRQSQTLVTEFKFKKHYENKIAIVSLAQEGKFGQTAKISAKVDLSGFDSDNLYFYSYDRKTNKYTRIENPAYRIDKNGYLHFEVINGGDIIISNGKLKKK